MPKFSPLVRAGWPVIPLKADGDKRPLVSGYHGKDRKVADEATVRSWAKSFPTCNPGIVLPDNVIGFDVDGPSHGVDGLAALEAFEREFGPLPNDDRIFHGYKDGKPSPYGTRLYRIPDECLDVYTPGSIVGNLDKVTGLPGVDVIAPWLRYNVAPGAVHGSGEVYEFYPSPSGPDIPWLPKVRELGVLTKRQVEGLLKGRSKAPAKPLVPSHGVKPIVAAEGPKDGRALLKQVEELAALPERKTLLIEGAQRGWQQNNGFYVLACSVARLAKDQEKAKRLFLKAAAAATDQGYDVEHEWDNAVASVEAEYEEMVEKAGEEPYPVSLAVSPGAFASEVLDREFRDDRSVLTLRHFDGGFWLWEGGRFVFVDPDDTEALLTAKMDGKIETGPDGKTRNVPWKTGQKRELLNALKDRARDSRYGLGGRLLPAVGGIPFRNGWLDVETGDLKPIGPERKIQWVIDANYDPEATCPEWEKFLVSCGFGPETDEYRLIRQWFGYLVSGSKKYEKGMLLIGKSRAGKGVMIRVAQALFGGVGPYGGAMAVEVETLVESHGYEGMPGKGLITLPETRFTGQDRKVNARLLSLTSNDSVRINPKMKTPFSTELPGRLMIGTNETPHFVEATDALAKRLLVVRFNVSHADNPDTGLYKRLVRELPGIANWALAGIEDLENEGRFTETAAGREVTEMIVEGGSYMREFLTDCFEKAEPSVKLSNDDMHKVYKEWRKDSEAPPMTPTRLAGRFTDTYPDIPRWKTGSKRGRYGLQIKPKWKRLLDLIYSDDDE